TASPAAASGVPTATPSIHKRPYRKTPPWRQPAVLGTVGALILFSAAAYYLATSGMLSTEVVKNEPNEVKPTAVKQNSKSAVRPDAERPGSVAADSPPDTTAPSNAPPSADKSGLEIVEATWGAGEQWTNVTEAVRKLVKDNRLMTMVWDTLLDVPQDAAAGPAKWLRLRYRSRGETYSASYPGAFFIYLDGNPPAPPTDSPDGLELLEARYGAGTTYVDVLPQVRQHLRNGRLSVPADQFASAAADELAKVGMGPTVFKVLWVRYRNRTGEHSSYAWNSDLLTIESALPATTGPPVNLLPLIDAQRDAVWGTWSKRDGQLLAPAEVAARIQIPFDPPDDYALTVVSEADGELIDVSAGLVVGGRQVLAAIDGGSDALISGLALVNGAWQMQDKNPTKPRRLAHLLEQGRPNTLTYIVRPTSVRMLHEGAEVVRWSGDPRTFAVPPTWQVPHPRRPYLQSYRAPFRVTKLELVPLAPDKSPVLVAAEPGAAIDLLANFDLKRDALREGWRCDGAELVSPESEHRPMQVQLPAVVPADYQLDVVAERASGNDCLVLTVPVQGTHASLLIDGSQGTKTGMQMLDGKDFMSNDVTRQAKIFADGKPHNITIRVRKNHVRLVCDGNPLVDWSGDITRLKPSETVRYHDRIYLGSWYSRYRLTKIALTPLSPEGAGEPSSALAGQPVDLLKQIDVTRDAVHGDWKMEDGVLVSPRERFSKLLLPPPPAEEYRLVAVVERLGGRYGLGVILKVGQHRVMLSIDGFDGSLSGLENIAGKSFPTHESTYKGRLLEDGKPATVVYTVRRNSIEVALDGRPIVSWEGDPATLVLPPDWQVPDPSRLALSEFDTMLRIHKLEISPLGLPTPGDSVATRPKPPDRPIDEPASPAAMQPPRSLADLTSNNARRQPVPDGDALKKAKQEMRKKFASSLKNARSPEQKRRLAQQLAQKASTAEGAQAYVLFGQAIDLAEAIGDLDLAWQTIDSLAQAFEVDRLALHYESLAAVAKGVKSPEAAWTLTDAACRLMVAALASGDSAAVKKAGAQAQTLAKRLNDRAAQKDVTDRANDAGTLADKWEAVAAARETLKTSPDDPQANFTVGHYELCAAGNWAAALPKLAKCGDPTWKKLAADELALDRQTFNTVRQAPTADGWWSLAEGEPWPGRHFLQMRAARRYRTTNRGRAGDTRLLAVERLKTLLALDDGLPNWELFQWRAFPQTFEPSGDVARIEGNGNVETAAEYSGPIEVLLIVRTSGTKLQMMSHRWGWGWDFTLVPDQWHALRYVINPLSRTVFVDGALAQTETWRTPRQFNPGPVSFQVNDDAVVEIRKFIVREL
ncbi:MAG TPA: hypothetical protein VJ783_09535, partial [Pirellulales bacterium]|nr:hypothetical protein [Pirellulales bacterium]